MYRGDSPGKKWARLMTWGRIDELLGNDRFTAGPHLVLSGPEAADVGMLFTMGVAGKRILAIDNDADDLRAAFEHWRKVIKWASHRYPAIALLDGVSFAHADVNEMRKLIERADADLFAPGPRKFASIFLDFCGPLCPALLHTIRQAVIWGLRDQGILAVNVLRGRERGAMRELLFASHRDRQVMLWRAFFERPDMRDRWLLPMAAVSYDSIIPGEDGGSPMYIMLFQLHVDHLRRSDRSRGKAYMKEMERAQRMFREIHAPTDTRSDTWMREWAERKRDCPAKFLSLVLNVPPGRIAAWRALATMEKQGGAA